MTKREELSKKIDEIKNEKDTMLKVMNKSIEDFVVNNCDIPNDVEVNIILDLGYLSNYTNHRLKDIDIRINLFANGENTDIKVAFENGKMYVKNNTIVGLSKEDKEDLVYITSYKVLHYLLSEGYDRFKQFVKLTVGYDIRELRLISTEIRELYDEIRNLK